MPRGVVPRQPDRTGRQDKVRGVAGAAARSLKSKSTPEPRPSQRQAEVRAAGVKVSAGSKAKGYNPIASERVEEILKRLNQLYPEVTCALTHRSAWELLVATILSAQ